MAATMTVHVQLRRVWPALWWIRAASWLVSIGLPVPTASVVRIGNVLLGWGRVECRTAGGKRLCKPQPFTGRIKAEPLDDGDVLAGIGREEGRG